MKVGISLGSAHFAEPGSLAAGWVLERGRAAARAGLDCLTIGDHHGTGPMPYVQNVPMLGRLLASGTIALRACCSSSRRGTRC